MDIISLPIEYDHKKIDGRFRLVMIASQRAKELAHGARPSIETKAKKPTTVALQEAIAGKLEYITGEEAIKAKEEAKKLDYRRLLEEAKRREEISEDMTELEKDLQVYLHERGGRERKEIEELFGEKTSEDATPEA